MGGIVIVDVDCTLVEGESFRGFVMDQACRHRRLAKQGILTSYLLRRIGRLSVESFKERCLAGFVGWHRRQLESVGREFTREWLVPRIRAGGRAVIDECQRNRDTVLLATGSVDIYIQALSDWLGLTQFIATELAYSEADEFSGRFAGGDCTGERKAKRVQQFASDQGFELEDATFYGDSGSDLDLMHLVGNPVAVWPDRRVKSECDLYGWPIEYW